MGEVLRVALYVRVSKKDSSQDVENQLIALREYCQRRGWAIVETYSDNESGRKGRVERLAFDQMFKDAARGTFDLLLFWSLDRLSREGIAQVLYYLQNLDGCGVRFHSYTEEFLNTENDMIRPLLIAFMSHLAAYEAKRISERTKAGLERARRQGKTLGRPRRIDMKVSEMDRLLSEGVSSPTEISRQVGISVSSVRRYLRTKRER